MSPFSNALWEGIDSVKIPPKIGEKVKTGPPQAEALAGFGALEDPQ